MESQELGVISGCIASERKQGPNVIGDYPTRNGVEKNYRVPALFMGRLASWEIPNSVIPTDPDAVAEWENIGKGLHSFAVRAHRRTRRTRVSVDGGPYFTSSVCSLVVQNTYENHRNRASLFERVRTKVHNHKTHLESRDIALTLKLANVSQHGKTLIDEVKGCTL